MTSDLPAWIPAEAGTAPALPVAEERSGRVVALLCTEGALAAGWAGSLAVDLVAAWSGAGSRILVADAGLSTPLLHEALGIPNHEGLVDALRWGVSVQRVVRRPEGRSFLALTVGTAVSDTAAVMALPRWNALCAGFREAGVTLAVLIPSWEEALPAVLDEADGLVILAESDEDLRPLLEGVDAPVYAVTGRTESEDAVSEDGGLDAAPVEDAAVDAAPGPELGDVQDEALEDGGAFVVVEDADADEDLGDGDDRMVLDDGPVADEPVEEVPVDDAPAEETPGDGLMPFAVVDGAGVEDGASEGVSSWGALADDGAPPFMEAGSEDEIEGEAPWESLEDARLEAPAEEPLADPLEEAGTEPLPEAVPVADDDFVLPDPIPVPPSLEEIVEESEAPAKRGRPWLLLILAVVILGAVAAAAWLGYIEIPGLTPSQGTASAAPAPTVAAQAPATATSGVLAYSLALGAYQDGVVAGQRVATLGTAVPGVLFQSVPVEVDGTLYYRVLAGPAADSAGVAALAARIADSASLDPSPWVSRYTPLAFGLGEMSDVATAERRVGALNGLGISAYILAVDYSDGTTRYRVFAGAFADETEASYLSGLLDERGLSSATLSDRIGRLPE